MFITCTRFSVLVDGMLFITPRVPTAAGEHRPPLDTLVLAGLVLVPPLPQLLGDILGKEGAQALSERIGEDISHQQKPEGFAALSR